MPERAGEVTVFNVLEDLFAPSRKHTDDERNRLELFREEEGIGDPARGPIDLSSGKVVMRPPRTSPENDAETDGEAEAEAVATEADA